MEYDNEVKSLNINGKKYELIDDATRNKIKTLVSIQQSKSPETRYNYISEITQDVDNNSFVITRDTVPYATTEIKGVLSVIKDNGLDIKDGVLGISNVSTSNNGTMLKEDKQKLDKIIIGTLDDMNSISPLLSQLGATSIYSIPSNATNVILSSYNWTLYTTCNIENKQWTQLAIGSNSNGDVTIRNRSVYNESNDIVFGNWNHSIEVIDNLVTENSVLPLSSRQGYNLANGSAKDDNAIEKLSLNDTTINIKYRGNKLDSINLLNNDTNQSGIVPAPTINNINKSWMTDENGKPSWNNNYKSDIYTFNDGANDVAKIQWNNDKKSIDFIFN